MTLKLSLFVTVKVPLLQQRRSLSLVSGLSGFSVLYQIQQGEKCCSDLKEITQVDFAGSGEGNCIVLGQAGQFLALPEYLMLSQLLWMWFIYYFACIQQTSVNTVQINSESFE